jgi:hypothetical protein
MIPRHRESYRIMRGQGTRRERAPWIAFRFDPAHHVGAIYVGHSYTREGAREIVAFDRTKRRKPRLQIVS